MTFGQLINILGLQESKFVSNQVKMEWIRFYFPEWKMFVIYEDKLYKVARYRNEDGIFDGTLADNNKFVEIRQDFDKLEIVIKNYKKLFIDVFENIYFQINFKDSI